MAHATALATTFVKGEYNIALTSPNRQPDHDVIIAYHSVEPTLPPTELLVGFKYALQSHLYGDGLAYGTIEPRFLEDGRVKPMSRNVLTFSGPGEPLP